MKDSNLNLLQQRLMDLWKEFDGSLVPGPWVGRSDGMILPKLDQIEAKAFHDSVGLESRADLHGVAEVDGEKYAWVGVIHYGEEPAGISDVNRLFDSAGVELATSMGEFEGVVPWLLSPAGIEKKARARLLEAGALFSNREGMLQLMDAYDIPTDDL